MYRIAYRKSIGRLSDRIVASRSIPVGGLALVLVSIIWLAAKQQIDTEQKVQERDSVQEAANLAVVFQQNVARTVSEIDRTILMLVELYESSDFSADWSALVQRRFALNEQTLQIGVTDESGVLIASSLGPLPPVPIDLSDRAHVRVHMMRSSDELFISKPVLGRMSGKWSIQFSRRYNGKKGGFGG